MHAKILIEGKQVGMTDEQIATLAKVKLKIIDSFGISKFDKEYVYTSRLQIVRRAIDYIKTYNLERKSLPNIVKVLTVTTFAHELGHKVHDITQYPTNNIDSEWRRNGDYCDNKLERFAEFWSMVPLGEKENIIRRKEWLIQLAKTSEVWEAINKYNANTKSKISIISVFEGIRIRLDKERDKNLLSFLWARQVIYRMSPIENYLSPYSQSVIKNAIEATNTSTQ